MGINLKPRANAMLPIKVDLSSSGINFEPFAFRLANSLQAYNEVHYFKYSLKRNLSSLVISNQFGKVAQFTFDDRTQRLKSAEINYNDYQSIPDLLTTDYYKRIFAGTDLDYDRISKPEYDPLLTKLKRIEQPAKELPPSYYKEAIGAFQREVVYTDSESNLPIACSYGAGPCVIVAAHNPETKKTALAHIDALTDGELFGGNRISTLHSLLNMLEHVRGTSKGPVEVHLAGDAFSGDKTAKEILHTLGLKDYVVIKSASLGKVEKFSESLAIDSRDGAIYTHFDSKRIIMASDAHKDENIIVRMSLPSPLNTAFGGTNLSGKEADLLWELEEAYKKAGKRTDKEFRDVFDLLSGPNNAMKEQGASLYREIGDLKPSLSNQVIDAIRQKYFGK